MFRNIEHYAYNLNIVFIQSSSNLEDKSLMISEICLLLYELQPRLLLCDQALDETIQHLNIPNWSISKLNENLADTLLQILPYDVTSNTALSIYSMLRVVEDNISTKTLSVFDKNQNRYNILLSEIDFIEVDGNYCFIRAKDTKYELRSSFQKLMPLLDENFIQIHRSCIVNVTKITSIDFRKNTVKLPNLELIIGKAFKKKILNFVRNEQKNS